MPKRLFGIVALIRRDTDGLSVNLIARRIHPVEYHEHETKEALQSGEKPAHTSAEARSTLESTAMPTTSIPLSDLRDLFIPASIFVPKSRIEDVVTILSATIYPFEDSVELDTALEELVRSIAAETEITRGAAASITPTHGDILLREIKTFTATDQKLSHSTAVEFELEHSRAHGCIVSVTRGTDPETLQVTLTWPGRLREQSSHAIENQWRFVEELFPYLSAIDAGVATVSPRGDGLHRFSLADGVTLDLVPRNERYSDILADPHLSLRPDLRHLCALRPRFEEDEERLELSERLGLLFRRLSKLHPDISVSRNFDAGHYTRETLADCGAVPFLVGSTSELRAFVIDQLILIATRESTGDSLLADLNYLEQLSASAAMVGPPPSTNRINVVEAASAPEGAAAGVFTALDIPAKDYFISALSDFVAYENIECEGDLIDGLVHTLSIGKPVTATLGREFIIVGKGQRNHGDAEEGEPWASPTWESTDNPENVELQRFTWVAPAAINHWHATPSIGFIHPYGGTAAEALHSPFVGSDPILKLSIRPNRHGESCIPEHLVRHFLDILGHHPDQTPMLAAEDDPFVGERTGYLSNSVRVRFTI